MNQKIKELYDAGKVDRAIHLLIKEIDQNPQQVENYLLLSSYLLEQGSVDQATKLLEQALHLVKRPLDLYYNLAVCYYSAGKFKRAAHLLDQIPNDDLTLYQKALVFLKLGQSAKALAFVLTIKKKDQRVKELTADIWLAMGELNQAKQVLLTIASQDRNAKVNFLLGIIYYAEDRNLAEEYFKKARNQDNDYYEKAIKQYDALLKMMRSKGNHE